MAEHAGKTTFTVFSCPFLVKPILVYLFYLCPSLDINKVMT